MLVFFFVFVVGLFFYFFWSYFKLKIGCDGGVGCGYDCYGSFWCVMVGY